MMLSSNSGVFSKLSTSTFAAIGPDFPAICTVYDRRRSPAGLARPRRLKRFAGVSSNDTTCRLQCTRWHHTLGEVTGRNPVFVGHRCSATIRCHQFAGICPDKTTNTGGVYALPLQQAQFASTITRQAGISRMLRHQPIGRPVDVPVCRLPHQPLAQSWASSSNTRCQRCRGPYMSPCRPHQWRRALLA